MQCGEFSAALKTMFVNSAFIVGKEMTGHTVHDHHAITAFFEVLLIKYFPGLVEVFGKLISFSIRDQHHQALTAIATSSAINLRGDSFVQVAYHAVDLLIVPFLHKYPETVIFIYFFCQKCRDPVQVGLNICWLYHDMSKLSFLNG